jgi:two-component system, OmpR family, phosphate regulon sensor histidine kinase PhoR
MSVADDGGAGQGWFVRLSRFLRARDDERTEVPADQPQTGAARIPPEFVLLDAVVSGMPDPVTVLDQDGRVIAFNAQASALAPALRRGEPASIALRMPELVEAVRAANQTGKPQRIEFSARLPAPRWSEAFVAPVALGGHGPGRAGVVVVTVHDLTPIRRADGMRADFVANVSHELRTPLAAITGFIDTLQGPAREDPAARDRFLGIMQAQAWRMARLIDDLLSLSRIELRAHQRPDTPVDLVAIVRQVSDGLQTLARDRDVTVDIKAPGAPLVVLGDRDELTRLFENLIENGLKYGASGKRVDIALTPVGATPGKGEAVVSVRDYGPGIAAEHLPRLTERFYRVDVGESRSQGGTGLGLALVKHILNRHQGRLTIDSKEGEGATFTVRLPLSSSTAPR